MALPQPLPPPPSLPRVTGDGKPTQDQIDFERKLLAWAAGLSGGGGGSTTIPLPTPTTLGGVKSATAPTHQFQTGINGSGSPTFAQPSAADVSGLGALATLGAITSSLISDATAAGKALLTAATVAAQKVALGLATIATSGSINDIVEGTTGTGKVARENSPSFPSGIAAAGTSTFGTIVATTYTGITASFVGGLAAVATSGSASDLGTGTLSNARTTATNANTASTIVARDASGNFSAGTITASLTGHASADLQVASNLSDLASAKTARSSTGLNIESGTGHGNSDYTITATDRWIYTNANFTAPRTWTLPAASSVNAGGSIIIDDLQNTLTATNTLTIARAGSDLINALSTLVLNVAGMRCVLISDGTSKWTATLSLTGVTGTGSVALSEALSLPEQPMQLRYPRGQ
jgi:hypothetical protein